MIHWIEEVRRRTEFRGERKRMSDEARVNDQRKLNAMFPDIAEKLLAHVEDDAEQLRGALGLRHDEMSTSRQWTNLIVMRHDAKSIQLIISIEAPVLKYSYTFTPGLTSPPQKWSGFIDLKMSEQGNPYLATERERFDGIWQAAKFLLAPFADPDFTPPA
jgi:hypothetical protein